MAPGLPVKRVYEASPRHCEPISAENPGVKCPSWSVVIAQELLDAAEPVGNALQATRDGVGFVGRLTLETAEGQVWHGYPEAWDQMDPELKNGAIGFSQAARGRRSSSRTALLGPMSTTSRKR